jgi:hypothetical protein
MAEAIVAGLALSLFTGGSLRRLAEEPLRGEWMLLILLPTQLMWPSISTRLGLPCSLSIVAWLLMMSALAVVLMINAPRRWMLAFAALGIAANVLVIGLNGAMPVSIRAASEIGATRKAARETLEDACLHEELDVDTVVPFLADVIAVPGPTWQRSVVSIGDVLLALGLGAWVFAAMRARRAVSQ